MKEEIILTIYVEGVVAEMLVFDEEDLHANRKFLESLVGREMAQAAATFPMGDPGHNFYALTKEQWRKFLEFRESRRVTGAPD